MAVKHLAEMQNTEADLESRKHETHTEWKFNESTSHFICGEIEFSPTIDLFVTRISTQLRKFFSCGPDPKYVAVNAILINWATEKIYTFPPFACFSKTLQKPKLAIATILPKVNRDVFTNYFNTS